MYDVKIPSVKIKKIIPVKKISTDNNFPIVVIDAALSGLEAIIVPPDPKIHTVNGQLKLTLRTRNRRIKKLADALLAAHANMYDFTQRQEMLHQELHNVNEKSVSSNEELQRLNEELQIRNDLLNESYDYSEAIIATIHEPMIILSAELRVKSANSSFYKNFRVKKEDTESALLYDLGNKQWNIPALRELLEDIIPKNTHFQDFEVTHTFPGIGEKIMLLNASRIVQKIHGTQLILLAIEDVTEVRMKIRELQEKDKALFNKNASERKVEKLQLEKLVEVRTKELARANQELMFQNEEKEKRGAELIIANEELVFQNGEKEKRAAELIIANKELVFQNDEKEKRAAELIVANKELVFQNGEKEKRATELVIANKELGFQNKEKEKRAAELIIANNELAFQNEEKEKRATELGVANKELGFQNEEKEKRAAELIIANNELAFQNEEKEKRATELGIANTELGFQNKEKEKRAAELIIANNELAFQNEEKEKRATELGIANTELGFQNKEKEKRAAELIIANNELAFQNEEKEKRATELGIANTELGFQNGEKEKRAAELIIANKELAFQNDEKEKRASELVIANTELCFENEEKGKRAAELIIANKELAFQNKEKEKRAAELIIANGELIYQNGEKEKRAIELVIANKELAFQNEEKEKRAAELIIANKELAFQNDEKEKREAELILANKELEAFTYVASHDLQEPLRKIRTFASRILEKENHNLTQSGKEDFERMQASAKRMQTLIEDLLAYSRISATERKFEKTSIKNIIEDIESDLKETIDEKNATISVIEVCEMCIIDFQFRQLMYNLISNALKFSDSKRPLHIIITNKIVKGSEVANENLHANKNYCHVSVADNGIGFDPEYKTRIFEVFQKLHGQKEYAGTGIGLAIVKKIVENHYGIITATGKLNIGATFDIYIPI